MATNITKIHPELKSRIEQLKDNAELFYMYYTKLEHTRFSGANPYQTELLIKNIKQVQSDKKMSKHMGMLTKSTINFDKPTSAEANDFVNNTFAFYSSVMNNHYKLQSCYEIFNEFRVESPTGSIISSSSSSSGQLEDIMIAYEKVSTAWEIYNTEVQTQTIEQILTKFLIQIIIGLSPDSRLKLLKYVKTIYDGLHKKGQGLTIIDLYSMLLRQTFTAVKAGENKQLMRYMVAIVEELKREVLPPLPRSTTNRKANTIQTLVQRHRLIPDGPCRPLNNLVNEIMGIKIATTNPLAELKKAAKLLSKTARKYGFIVISKRTPHPIENNIWLLTDVNYLQKEGLMQPSTAGVSENVLKRAKTISFLKRDSSEKVPPLTDGIYTINTEFGKDPRQNYYYVLETLDGVNFRVMFPWYLSPFAKKKIYEIPAVHMPDLDLKKAPSTRIEAYNDVLNTEITRHLVKPYFSAVTNMSRLERKREEVKWNVVRIKISRGMVADYRQLFDKTPPRAENILGLITHPMVFSNALQYIIHSIIDTISGIKQRTEIYYSEIYMASLESLNRLKSEMAKEVENIYKENYAPKMAKLLKSGASVRTTIKVLDLLENVLLDMLKKYITEKSNVYSAINQKIELLESIYS